MRLESPPLPRFLESNSEIRGTNGCEFRTCKIRSTHFESTSLTDQSWQLANFDNDALKQDLPLDVNVLCAKLETARQEQDEKERRRRQRRLAHRNSSFYPEHATTWTTTPMLEGLDRPRRSDSTKQCQTQLTEGAKRDLKPRPSRVMLDVGMTENVTPRQAEKATPRMDYFQSDHRTVSPRRSVQDVDAVRPKLEKDRSKRQSIASFFDLLASPSEKSPQSPASLSKRPSDTAKRRSFMSSKRGSMATYERIEIPANTFTHHEMTESPMGLINEYTVSYDTCAVKYETDRSGPCSPQPIRQSYDRARWSERSDRSNDDPRRRSLMSLPSLLKKDRIQVKVDEITELPPLTEHQEAAETRHSEGLMRPGRGHVRQASENGLISNAVATMKKEDRHRRRRTVAGFFQGVFIPHNSMSMHGVAI